MGDYFDFTSFSQRKIIATSRDEVKTYLSERVEEMILQLLVLLRSTKDRWLGMIEGNHYWEFDDGTTSDQKLCEAMNCHFLGTDAKITLKFDKAPIGHPEIFASIFCVHGANAPEYVGTNLNKIERLLEWLDADIFLMGHSHRKVGAPIDRVQFTPEGIEYHRTKVIARTGGWYTPYHAHSPLSLKKPAIQSRGTYIEKKAGSPSALGTLVIGIGYERIMGSKYYRPTIHYSM
jgi:hypothetical protein